MREGETIEYYGFKASDLGKFNEWQNVQAQLREIFPHLPSSELAERSYKLIE
jgi:hypothetical protein|tara:strand:- start:871 stop:1026 length:156 start_codon:yes stop_codon:yes gene_type:complete